MKLLPKIIAIALLLSAFGAQAQRCGTSGPSICTVVGSLSAPGFSPPADSVPCAIDGVPYAQVVQVKIPTTVTSGGSTYPINWLKIDTISNLPCGLCWATDQARDSFAGGSQFCLKVSGTTYDNPGQYELRIIVDVNVTAYGFLHITQANQNASAAGLSFAVRVQSPGGSCPTFDTSAGFVGLTSSAYGPAPSSAVTASGPLSFCQGGSVTLTATQTGGQYQWMKNGSPITGATSRAYTADSAASYTCMIVANCMAVTSAAQVVSVNPSPAVSVSPAGPVILCGGSSQVLTATTSGGTIQWFQGTAPISGATAVTDTALATGNYYAVVTQSGCTDTSNRVNVQISGTPPSPALSASTLNLCSGALDTLNAGAGYTAYTWSGGLGNAQYAVAGAAGTYTVTVANGVCVGTGTITINSAAATPTPTTSPSGPQSVCSGSSITLSSSSAASYLWSNGATTQSITVDSAGSYYVSTNNGCGPATSSAVSLGLLPQPNDTVSPAGPVVLCGSGSSLLTAPSGSGYSYQWLDSGNILIGETSATYLAASTGLYSCQVSGGGCTDTSNVVNVQISTVSLSPAIAASKAFLCPGATDTLDAGAGYSSYNWSGGLGSARYAFVTSTGTYSVTVQSGVCTGTATFNLSARDTTPTPVVSAQGPTTFCTGGSVVLVSSSDSNNVWSNGALADSITASATNFYTVTVNNGCGARTSAPVFVSVNNYPTAAISPAGPVLICGGSSQVLTAALTAGATYSWLANGSAAPAQSANSDTASTTGSYQVVVSLNGCTDTSAAVNVTVSGTPPTPVITPTSLIVCPGARDTLDVGAGYTSYAWSGGLGSAPVASVTSGGTYSVTVANGVCVGSASISINQGTATPTPAIQVTGSLHLCGSDSVVLTSSAATGNHWSNSATTRSITESAAGIFTVTVNGQCGSATSAPDTVLHFPNPTLSLGPDTGACTGTPIVLDAVSSAPSIIWYNGHRNVLDTVTTSGTYTATATQNGCSSTDTVVVGYSTVPSVSFTNNAGVLTATAVPGATYVWYKSGSPISGPDSSVFNANPYGTAYYSVQAVAGYCSGAVSAPVLVTITGIEDVSRNISASVYPNPAGREVNIACSLTRDEELSIELSDMTGRSVAQLFNGSKATGNYLLQADLSKLSPGVYFVSFHTAEGTLVKKFVKE